MEFGDRERGSMDAPQAAGVSLARLLGVIVFAAACLGFHWFGSQGWVPLLDSANLAFHEAGHPLVDLFSARLSVYGGTLLQLLFPALALWNYRRAGNATGLAGCMVWLGENLLNVARYMADARAQALPLVGGGEHDWTEIFNRWGVLHLDTRIAGMTHGIGVLLIVGAGVWLYRCRRSGPIAHPGSH